MFGELDRAPFLRRNDEARSLTAIGLSVLAVVIVLCGGIVAMILAGIDLVGDGAFPAPATILLLLLGFVLFFAPRRRRAR